MEPTSLARFLADKRRSIPPDTRGIADERRRRGPGLTREDLARLAGVSLRWYSALESGERCRVSRPFAERLAAALALDDRERRYLFGALGFADRAPQAASAAPSAALRRLMQAQPDVPFALYSPLFDLIDCNAACQDLFPPPAGPEPLQSNKLWRTFRDPAFRAQWHDWEAVARRIVGDFRYMSAHLQHTLECRRLLEALADAPGFDAIWREGGVTQLGGADTRFTLRRPDGRVVTIEPTVMQHLEAPGLYLAALTIVDAAPV